MYPVSQNRQKPIVNVDTLDQLEPAVRDENRRLYHVEELRANPFPSRHTSRAWGKLIRHNDGRVELEPDPWEA